VNEYQIIIYWSDEDKAFIAEAPELPGAMADGPTRRKALANAEVIIREWIETARELGRPVPRPQGRLLSVAEAADRLGLGVAMARRHCLTGNLPARKVGRDWVIGERDLTAFAEKTRQRGRPKQALAVMHP
jgi:excisionase family DNA binding protein